MTRIEGIWADSLEKTRRSPITDGDFRIFAIDPIARQEFYAGNDSEMHVLLALRVSREPPRVDLDSEAITCFSRNRRDGSWLLVFRLEQPGLAVVFDRLCEDLVDGARPMNDEPSLLRFIVQRVHLWKRLFRRLDNGFLPEQEIKGLVGELLVLESLLTKGEHLPLEVVTAWEGPLEADQDFRLHDRIIEVKTIGPAVTEVTIASLKQLDAPPPFELIVVAVRMTNSLLTGASVTLNTLVRRLWTLLEFEPDASVLFRERLLSGGYVVHPHYDEFWFTVTDRRAYSVETNFPRLTLDTVPVGIVAATYCLSLDKLEMPSSRPGATDA